ncbi:site-specific integrase [Paenibacillus popilliae]|uniref:Site-specific integrase n=1 Tax=Paenibacillus popilliae TaxID=78057 RepID=A0ABY3AUH0_PAEPP|nr:site-specific integrase [Paenibacillus sp. SDF0028]TQR46391.1 site-specific integrase [Paenibacillus sp. SDF0028]
MGNDLIAPVNREEILKERIPDVLLYLSNSEGSFWDKVADKNFNYFTKHCIDHPWANHFALALLCLTDRDLTPQSIMNIVSVLNARFRDIFSTFELKDMNAFTPSHIEKYIRGEVLPEHSDRQRQFLLSGYNTFMFNINKWISAQFSEETQKTLLPYVLPKLPFDNRDFNARTKAITNAKAKRKDDTSAITSLLPEIRAQGHLRWNQVKRIRESQKKLMKAAMEGSIVLPVEFSYEESEYANERWHFVLWDISSYEHVKLGINRLKQMKEEDFFLEFKKAENINNGLPGEGPWFLDLLKHKLIGNLLPANYSKEHFKEIMRYLKQFGYEPEDNSKSISPFSPRNVGLLTQGFNLSILQRTSPNVFINIEPIYVACMFARFALDIITCSGARINELLQISYDKDCCIATMDNSVSPPRTNYIFRLTPKGREEPENYYVPEELFKFMTEIIKMLRESYKSDSIPEVKYEVDSRKHLIPPKKYIFQYRNKHINHFSINATLRFLLHGIIIQNSNGDQVKFKAHLLRHAFATHAVQNEKIPIDIVKTLLHQKDIEVTSYYSAPTHQQIAESINQLQDNWVSYIDVQKGILRAPEELKEIYNEYRKKVGTLSKVVGGTCTIDSVCPTKMACIGCAAKVPQPEFKEEIMAYYKWADESQKRFEQLGLEVEARKMKVTKNRARNELKEIELIERYQKDQEYIPELQINKN